MTWYGAHGFGVAPDVQTYSKYFVQAIHSAFSDRNIQLDMIVCEGKFCGAHGYLTGNFSGDFLGQYSARVMQLRHKRSDFFRRKAVVQDHETEVWTALAC